MKRILSETIKTVDSNGNAVIVYEHTDIIDAGDFRDPNATMKGLRDYSAKNPQRFVNLSKEKQSNGKRIFNETHDNSVLKEV